MKKCILFLTVCLLISCSTDSVSTELSLSPPEWLQGSWEDERSQNDSFTQIQIEVSSKNVKIISGGGIVVLDIVGMARNANDAPNGSASIDEEIKTGETYEFNVTVNLDNAEIQRTAYRFEKIDSERITFYQNNVSLELNKTN
ncbi:hypothetical protein JM83_1691 [Gillisia sp. Hel_I_86]|uniref:hypothetical protein n=1 Tax=Gillisia sp. Hel_I_86 TaxID=1249981 RepID=UPI00119C8408|nr:hypothetical protein [Gillisia sp. Hel_I_86]TVZ26704.1 hypothetical protein JM83_1691 [Gillisia sp. Hel_I_86]